MPGRFLTNDQRNRFSGFMEAELLAEELGRYFFLDDHDRRFVGLRKGEKNQLGLALQLCTVRYLGYFLSDPREAPAFVTEHIGKLLSIPDPVLRIADYKDVRTRKRHVSSIKKFYGYRSFHDQPEHFRFMRWLYLRAWLTAERPIVLFERSREYLKERGILLPSVMVLERTVSRVNMRVAERLWRCLKSALTPFQRKRLESLLKVEEDERYSGFDRLRKPPVRISAKGLVGALERVREVRSLGVGTIDLTPYPRGRVKVLSQHAMAVWAASISKMSDDRRAATLLAWAQALEISAVDDALDVLDQLINRVLSFAKIDGQKERLRTLHEYDQAVLDLVRACELLMDPRTGDSDVRDSVFSAISKRQLIDSVTFAKSVARDDQEYYEELDKNYSTVRQFVPRLFSSIEFDGVEGGRPVLAALRYLRSIEGTLKRTLSDAPQAIVSKSWKALVVNADGNINRRYYTFCVLENLRKSLRRRDIFVPNSERWGDPRAELLGEEEWEARRKAVCSMLKRSEDADEEFGALRVQLNRAYAGAAAEISSSGQVRIESENGKDKIVCPTIDSLDEPDTLRSLQSKVNRLLPEVELSTVLLQINAVTDFCSQFTHINEKQANVKHLDVSICAVLLAEACNIGLDPVVSPENPALTRSRLLWVRQNFIRTETISAANELLVEAQAQVPLAQLWGGGEVASADGLRFVVPVRSINAGPNPKYFNAKRGITYYNYTSDHFSGFYGTVIPGTLRDSLFILDGLLENQTCLRPQELMADTAGYSDVIFALFWLLGYQFSPRLADVGGARFWHMGSENDYGCLRGIARNKINEELIKAHWDDILRIAGSLKLGKVRASDIIRTLGGRRTTLAKALTELGRIPKTLHLLSYVSDDAFRRRILTQLNRGEGRNGVARAVCYGKRGEIYQRYREGQENQLGVLGLVVNAIVLWNTMHIERIAGEIKERRELVLTDDLMRLSPLVHRHINMLGKFSFDLEEAIRSGKLREILSPSQNRTPVTT